jgi:hypothetical protein
MYFLCRCDRIYFTGIRANRYYLSTKYIHINISINLYVNPARQSSCFVTRVELKRRAVLWDIDC